MDQSSFAAPHGLSQRITSFIACACQGIHQLPLRHLIVLIANAHHLFGFGIPVLFAKAQRGAKSDHPGKPEFAAMDHVRLTIMRTRTDTVTFYNRAHNDAIDVFNRSALSELRRAARLQPVIRPASRDQIRYRAVRQRQSDPPSEVTRRTPTTNDPERQASHLPPIPHLAPVG